MTDLVDLAILISREIKDLQVQLKRICHLLNAPPVKKWYNSEEVMQLLDIKARTLLSLRTKGKIPYSKINNKFYYKVSDIEKILETNYSTSKQRDHGIS